MDCVAHCGDANRGSYVNSLVLTDIASGWTEAAPLVVRESGLLVETLERVRLGLPFALRALDVDNGSESLNQLLSDSWDRTHSLSALAEERPGVPMPRSLMDQSTARLALPRPPMQRRPALRASIRTRGLGNLPVKAQQQLVKSGIPHDLLHRLLHVLAPAW